MSVFKCPNCGGSDKKVITAFHHRCTYCQTLFEGKQKLIQDKIKFNNEIKGHFETKPGEMEADEICQRKKAVLGIAFVFLFLVIYVISGIANVKRQEAWNKEEARRQIIVEINNKAWEEKLNSDLDTLFQEFDPVLAEQINAWADSLGVN